MIYDNIENIDLYNLDTSAVEFIKQLTPETECKKHIINERVYANVEEYTTKENGFFEAHKKYIDIQILLKGEEIIECTAVKPLKIKDEYDCERDIAFYFDGDSDAAKIKLSNGLFTVLYPHEAHKPQLTFKTEQKVKKVVVKILAE